MSTLDGEIFFDCARSLPLLYTIDSHMTYILDLITVLLEETNNKTSSLRIRTTHFLTDARCIPHISEQFKDA
jgi:hypothetical protein